MKRGCGILLHITSLPSDEGIGSLDGAVEFLDFLYAAGATYWQFLPLSIPDRSNSPYSSMSAFAANPYLIGVKKLVSDGFVSVSETVNDSAVRGFDPAQARTYKDALFRLAFERFVKTDEYCSFIKKNGYWLKDYSVYAALTDRFGCRSTWDAKFKTPDTKAVRDFIDKNKRSIEYHVFLQYLFFKQWDGVRREARLRGVKLTGDIPFYVSFDSADVWAHGAEFKLDGDLLPKKIAGVPPDYFSADGQLWGNPVYDLEGMRKTGYRWWLERIKQAKSLYDCVRIDHFRAFDAYYEIDASAKNARKGKWIKGDAALVGKIVDAAGETEIIAEDLGVQSKGLDKIMKDYSLKGMKILQFAFDGGFDNSFLPHNYNENCVAYLGTHDNDTTLNWWRGLDDGKKDKIFSYTGFESDKETNRKFMKLLCRSRAALVIFTMQDVINSDKRMNTPGTTNGNWEFMLDKDDLNEADARYLSEINAMFGRNPR